MGLVNGRVFFMFLFFVPVLFQIVCECSSTSGTPQDRKGAFVFVLFVVNDFFYLQYLLCTLQNSHALSTHINDFGEDFDLWYINQ